MNEEESMQARTMFGESLGVGGRAKSKRRRRNRVGLWVNKSGHREGCIKCIPSQNEALMLVQSENDDRQPRRVQICRR